MYSVDEMKKAVVDMAKLLNAGSKLANGQGALSAVWDAVPLVKDVLTLNMDELKKEISEVDPSERVQLEEAFKGALSLVNQDVQAKIVGAVSSIEEGFAIVAEGVDVVQRAVAYVLKLKSML
jgi:hypothetical protein